MIRPTRLAAGALVALLGTLACADASRSSGPESSSALSTSATLLAGQSSTPGPITSRLAPSMCMDVWGGSTDNGAQLVVWPCHGGTNQQFTWQPSGDIVQVYGTKCLDAAYERGWDGDPVTTWACHGYTNQQWHYTSAGEIRGINDKCITIDGVPTNGQRLVIKTCDGSSGQKWNVPMTGGSTAPTAEAVSTTTTTTTTTDQSAPPTTNTSTAGVTAPELPRTYLNTNAVAPTGATINVRAGDNLQAAIDAAKPGDVLLLQPGATFVGNFILPNKSGTGWVTIRTAASDASLPAPGTRITPAYASVLPKIVTPNVTSAIQTAEGAHHYRLVGVEVTASTSIPWAYVLVSLGDWGPAQSSMSQVPNNIVLDRVYLHGSPTLDIRRCVALNSASTAIIDSWLADCHSRMNESQGIAGWNGPGPFKIVNNFIEGGAENIMFGGTDPNITNLVPSDIEIRRNHFFKPLSWQGVWPVKNLFELKNAQRVLVEGNVFENNWLDAQVGFAIVLKSTNQDGTAPWSVTRDVTFQNNIVRRVAGGVSLSGTPIGSQAQPMTRIRFANNSFEQVGDPSMGGAFTLGRLYQVEGPDNVEFSHNSGVTSQHGLVLYGEPSTAPFVFRDNVVDGGTGIISADGQGVGTAALQYHTPAWNLRGNVIGTNYAPTRLSYYPSSNTYTVNGATSGVSTQTTDGAAVGVDRATVNAKTAGVIVTP